MQRSIDWFDAPNVVAPDE